MWAGLIAVGLVLGYLVRRRAAGSARVNAARQAAVWLLQTLLIAVLLLMLWHPALSIATLRAQQNIVAVLVDDSASMAHPDEAGGATRRAAAIQVLNSALQPTPITLAKFPGYLAGDMNVRVFTYTGPRTAITALSEQFHP